MFTPRLYLLLASIGVCAPVLAYEPKTLNVATGSSITFDEITANIISFLSGAIPAIALAMFVVGAFMVTVSGVKEEYRQTGKNLMIGAVMSLAVVLGAYALLRTVDFFLTN